MKKKGLDINDLQRLAGFLILLGNGVIDDQTDFESFEYKDPLIEDIVKKLLEKGGTKTLENRVNGYTPLHTAVSKGSLEIVKLLVERGEGSLVEKKSLDTDGKEETAFQLAVRSGYTDIVDFLKEHDNSWIQSLEEIVKTVYPALAGGHKNILQILINEGSMEEAKINGDLLMRAVENNNLTAVNNLYAAWDGAGSKTLKYPPDFDIGKALSIAEKNKNVGQEKESKMAQQIIEKLSSPDGSPLNLTAPEIQAQIDKEKKQQYRRLVNDLKRLKKGDEFKQMDYYVEEFSKLCNPQSDPPRLRSFPSTPF